MNGKPLLGYSLSFIVPVLDEEATLRPLFLGSRINVSFALPGK